jgi:hypothetical protein
VQISIQAKDVQNRADVLDGIFNLEEPIGYVREFVVVEKEHERTVIFSFSTTAWDRVSESCGVT